MKNKKITLHELMGLMKDGKAPKKIKWGTNIYKLHDSFNDYVDEDGGFLISNLRFITNLLNEKIEILPEENEKNNEWKDIYTLGDIEEYHFMNRRNDMTQEDRRLLDSNFKILGKTINQLIKNQKYLKEKLESKDGK